MTPQTIHRLWTAWVRYWLPTRSVRDSRRYALGPDRNEFGLPGTPKAVHHVGNRGADRFKAHTPSKR
jgi:hypothetical protein